MDLEEQKKKVDEEKVFLKNQKLEDGGKKINLEEEAQEIFTLYELTKEITKSLHADEAFKIFKNKLHENLSFEDCRLLDPFSPEVKTLQNNKDFFVFALQAKEDRIGYLAVKGALDQYDHERITILGNQFALALRRAKLYEEVEKVAITDSLTDVHTRRYLLERFNEEIERSNLHKIKMSFLMIDVDFFKSFNDKYGHLTGDQILVSIAHIIKQSIREIDIPGRYGGEEFCVVLPDTDREGAYLAAERIRQSTEKTPIKAYDAQVQATVSIGIATFPEDGKTAADLIDRADGALYIAKKQGRNRVYSLNPPK